MFVRKAGILMPIFSLPGKYGIGTLGKKAYEFVDFLEKAGQSYWQILPLTPTSFGDSPYQSFSAYACNPYFIDFELLEENGYLIKSEYSNINWGKDEKIDYTILYNQRYNILKKAFKRFINKPTYDYFDFINNNKSWIEDYSLFMAIKIANNGKAWNEWPSEIKCREPDAIYKCKELYKENIEFFKVIEYLFYVQWCKLKKYANSKNIKIIGDIPIYVAYDSADLWCEPKQFLLDDELKPIEVAGCPPDAFSIKGQLWGNPLYDWNFMKMSLNPYEWWKKRIAHTLKLYDIIRIDHFRGFESYYAIPYGNKDAIIGTWRKGPGIHFFDALKNQFSDLPIIAEDLGFFTNDVKQMLLKSGFPGMKVLEFGFDELNNSAHLPHNCVKNSVVYTGTHDNDTIMGWIKTLDTKKIQFIKDYLGINNEIEINWAIIRCAFATVADTVIIPMQDYLGLSSEGRINIPSTLGDNWKWRIKDGVLDSNLADRIRKQTQTYYRLS